MDSTTTDNSPVEGGNFRYDQDDEEGASGDHDNGADDDAASGKLMYNNIQKKKLPKRIEALSQSKRKK